jgi:hypothetical protein
MYKVHAHFLFAYKSKEELKLITQFLKMNKLIITFIITFFSNLTYSQEKIIWDTLATMQNEDLIVSRAFLCYDITDPFHDQFGDFFLTVVAKKNATLKKFICISENDTLFNSSKLNLVKNKYALQLSTGLKIDCTNTLPKLCNLEFKPHLPIITYFKGKKKYTLKIDKYYFVKFCDIFRYLGDKRYGDCVNCKQQ